MDKRILTLTGGILTGMALLVVMLCYMHGYDRAPITQPAAAQIKKEIAKDKVKKDSVQKITVFVDRERIKYVNKYREKIIHDTIPCEEKLQICDTIIKIDSTLISELKAVIKIDNLIIEGQDKVIRADSLTISGLTKKVKKEKLKSWWKGFKAGFVAGNITGVAGSQLTNR